MLCVQEGNNALHFAAKAGHVPVIIYLFENGFLLDAKNKVRKLEYRYCLDPNPDLDLDVTITMYIVCRTVKQRCILLHTTTT